MSLPEDASTYGTLELMFATRSGNVRRNALSDFESINRNGKIAMKLDAGDAIVAVAVATSEDDVAFTTAQGKCVRFLIKDEVRVFKGRDSDGVRAIRLEEGDSVISMAILQARRSERAPERAAYLKHATALTARFAICRGGCRYRWWQHVDADEDETEAAVELTPERIAELSQPTSNSYLTVSERGFGKRSSSYEYRTSGRGGKGIVAMVVNDRNGPLDRLVPDRSHPTRSCW